MSLEPIPFAGMVEVDLDLIIEEMYGKNPKNMPKYIVLGDGSLYIFHKEEDRYALCEQITSLQEGISATTGAGGTATRNARERARYAMDKKGVNRKGKDIDHVIPLSKGGTNAASNLKLKSPSSNRSFSRNSDHTVKRNKPKNGKA